MENKILTIQLINPANGARSPEVTGDHQELLDVLADFHDKEFFVIDVTIISQMDEGTQVHFMSRMPLMKVNSFSTYLSTLIKGES